MEVDILFEQIVFLPQRADLLSVHMCSQHHVEFCVQSESDETSYIVECFVGLDENLVPVFQTAFDGTSVLEHPLMDGEDTLKAIEFFNQMALNEEHLVDSQHNVNRYTLKQFIKEVEENANDVL